MSRSGPVRARVARDADHGRRGLDRMVGAADPVATGQPNIVYILADDLGWKDVGFHGSDIETPNIDALAAGGARLEQFYTQPICTPTRAALMTGRYPLRYGLQTAVIPSDGTYGLATDEWLLPQALKDRRATRRRSSASGTSATPSEVLAAPARLRLPVRAAARRDRLLHALGARRRATGSATTSRSTKTATSTTLLGDDAVRLIRRARPGEAALPLPRVHRAPLAVPGAAGVPRSLRVDRRSVAPRLRRDDHRDGRPDRPRARSARREAACARIRSIVFHSDNGGTRYGEVLRRGRHVEVQIPCDNGPYATARARSTRAARASWRSPTGPATSQPGTIVDEAIHVVDMYPTLAEARGRDNPASKPLDGVDVWPDDRGGQAVAAHRGRLQRRAVPGRHPRGRVEARVEADAAVAGRALRPRAPIRARSRTSPRSIRRRSRSSRSACSSSRARARRRCC